MSSNPEQNSTWCAKLKWKTIGVKSSTLVSPTWSEHATFTFLIQTYEQDQLGTEGSYVEKLAKTQTISISWLAILLERLTPDKETMNSNS